MEGWHFVKAARCRMAPDFAEALNDIARHYVKARRIHLLLGNLNIHGLFSLTRRFGWREGIRLCRCLRVHYMPKPPARR